MDVLQIIYKYLSEHGYDGLCNPDLECGCGKEDLAPCSELSCECSVAYRCDSPCGDPEIHYTDPPRVYCKHKPSECEKYKDVK